MIKAKFTFDPEDSPVWEGYHDPGKRWNGWACPWFDVVTALEVATYLDDRAQLHPDGALVFHEQGGESEEDLVVMYPTALSIDDTPLYDFGGGYCFNVVEEKKPEPPPTRNLKGYQNPFTYRLGELAHETLMRFFEKHGLLYSGGQKVFYTPEEWRAKGEPYGQKAVLVVCHDGGAHAPAFNWDYGDTKLVEALRQELEAVGLYVEGCTCWYSGIYPIETS